MPHTSSRLSERWFRLLLRLYPPDFRDEMGEALVEAYRDRSRDARARGGNLSVAMVWVRALIDAVRNGPAERARPAVQWRRSGNWGRDLELVTRRLVRAPAFTAVTVATLTVGLGMFAVVYTAVHKILIAPMSYPNPDDLYFVWRDYGPIFDLKRGSLGRPDIVELQKAGGVIEAVAPLQQCDCGLFSVREGADPMDIIVTVSSPNLFTMLGVEPVIGRGFAPDEIGPGRQRVIVLTHELWTRLGADSAVLGSEVRVNGQPYMVIGVLPPKFEFVRHESIGPPQRADAYTTFNVNLAEMKPQRGLLSALIRARHGTSPKAVAAAVDVVGRAIDARDFQSRGLRLYPVGLKPDLIARVRPALFVLGAAGLVLALMLMVNLSSVLLARAAQREHEFAVSRALGANAAAVMRASLFEGAALGLAGGAFGALTAIWGTRALVALTPTDLPRREAIAVDWSIALVIVGAGLLLGAFAAVVPALWAARTSLSVLLASSAVRGGGGHGRLRRSMVIAQVALSLVLLCSGALVARSFEQLLRSDPGFRADGVLTFFLRTPPGSQLSETIPFHDRVQSALTNLPGVTGVGAVSGLPLSGNAAQAPIRIPGAPGNTGDAERDAPLVDVLAARAGYVEVMDMRLVAGRTFEPTRHAGVLEAVIDHALARRFYPNGNALGARIPFRDSLLTVVGVVQQARLHDIHEDGRPQMFIHADDWGLRGMFYAIRTERDPASLIPEVRSAIRKVDRRVPVGNPRTMEAIVDDALRQQRTSATLIAAFALGAVLLAAMGLYGVVSGSVTRRRHELAVRLALGADKRRVLRLVLREGALLVGMGVLIGLPGIYVAGRILRGVLVGVSPRDPLTLLSAVIGLALIAMAACYVPARRALVIDPARLLRQE